MASGLRPSNTEAPSGRSTDRGSGSPGASTKSLSQRNPPGGRGRRARTREQRRPPLRPRYGNQSRGTDWTPVAPQTASPRVLARHGAGIGRAPGETEMNGRRRVFTHAGVSGRFDGRAVVRPPRGRVPRCCRLVRGSSVARACFGTSSTASRGSRPSTARYCCTAPRARGKELSPRRPSRLERPRVGCALRRGDLQRRRGATTHDLGHEREPRRSSLARACSPRWAPGSIFSACRLHPRRSCSSGCSSSLRAETRSRPAGRPERVSRPRGGVDPREPPQPASRPARFGRPVLLASRRFRCEGAPRSPSAAGRSLLAQHFPGPQGWAARRRSGALARSEITSGRRQRQPGRAWWSASRCSPTGASTRRW